MNAGVDPRRLARLPGLQWKARYVVEGFLPGRHGSPFYGGSVEFRDHREYQPGDDPRRLDWRLYARSDRLYVRRHEHETNARCYLLVDASASMDYRGEHAWGSKMEAARTLGLALTFLLLRQSDAVGVVAIEGGTTRYLRPSQKSYQAALVQRRLESVRPGGGPVLATLLERASALLHRRGLVILLSDLLEPSEGVERGLRRLRFEGHEIVCLQILDGDEIDFPFDDSAVFEDMETGERRRVAGSDAAASYRARFQAFQAGWRDLLRGLDARQAVVRTDGDPAAALTALFGGAARARTA